MKPAPPIKKIALIVAMDIEARPIIESLQLQKDSLFGDPILPFEHFRGTYDSSIDLLLSLNGKDPRYGVDNIGTEPATLNAYITLKKFSPDLCINLGTAGGFAQQNAQIGDIYLSQDAFRFHDRRIPFAGFEEYGVGHYPTVQLTKMAQALGLKQGVVTTANSLDYHSVDMEMMIKNNASVKEMEAAGIAWVAHLMKIPFFAVKSITDFVDSTHPTADQFLRNFAIASQSLHSKTLEILKYLVSHPAEWSSTSNS